MNLYLNEAETRSLLKVVSYPHLKRRLQDHLNKLTTTEPDWERVSLDVYNALNPSSCSLDQRYLNDLYYRLPEPGDSQQDLDGDDLKLLLLHVTHAWDEVALRNLLEEVIEE